MTATNKIFGSDILADKNLQAQVSSSGELLLTDGVDTGLQDVRIRLFTPLGSLFYDAEFGTLIHEWIRDENTQIARMGFAAEVERRVKLDPRMEAGTVSCVIQAWDNRGITAGVSFRFINETNIRNLVIEVGADMDLVIRDVYSVQ